MKLAFVYSGQGDQYVGMGKEMYENEKIVKETFEEASDLLGYDMARLCFIKNDLINQTEYTQPAILTVSVALNRLIESKEIIPDVVAGLSLGEYSALVASKALSFEKAIKLVSQRGKFMGESAAKGTGKMIAVMSGNIQMIESVCKEASFVGVVSPTNYNTPNQTVIGGEVEAVDYACNLLKSSGIDALVPLRVSGPFHTSLLENAAEKFGALLETIHFESMKIPVISNVSAEIMKDEEVKYLLKNQVKLPVLWNKTINKMNELGVETIIQIGPGKTIERFIKQIDSKYKVGRIEDSKTLFNSLELLNTHNFSELI
ncbi:ACP S-malonyltransferase [Bacillus cereus]|uniref:ACP S-malonyltransferase n=1 Tax=Bacillus cereus TaxID=1396 RepID=UPI0038178985